MSDLSNVWDSLCLGPYWGLRHFFKSLSITNYLHFEPIPIPGLEELISTHTQRQLPLGPLHYSCMPMALLTQMVTLLGISDSLLQ